MCWNWINKLEKKDENEKPSHNYAHNDADLNELIEEPGFCSYAVKNQIWLCKSIHHDLTLDALGFLTSTRLVFDPIGWHTSAALFNEDEIIRAFALEAPLYNISDNPYYSIDKEPIRTRAYIDLDAKRPPHLTFIIDGLSSLLTQTRYEKYVDSLIKIAREGLPKGISVVFAATDVSGGYITKLLPHFKRIIALDLPKSENYFELFGKAVNKTRNVERRGFINLDTGIHEFQGFLPFRTVKQVEEAKELYTLIESMKDNANVQNLSKEKSMVNELNINDKSWRTEYGITNDIPAPGHFLAGLDYYTFVPHQIDLRNARSIAIYGSKGTGKTNLLLLILRGALSIRNVRFVIWNDKRGGLDEIKAWFESKPVAQLLGTALDPTRVIFYETQDEFVDFVQDEYNNALHDPQNTSNRNANKKLPLSKLKYRQGYYMISIG